MDKKNQFLSSRAHLQLDYIINRLTGAPGLLKTAQGIREKLNLGENSSASLSGNELAASVFSNMRVLIRQLPDQKLAVSLDEEVGRTLSQLDNPVV